MVLSAITGTYINPRNGGAYPNARIEYIGERHTIENKRFVFLFELLTENGDSLGLHPWIINGETVSGNTIQNHGEILLSGGTSGETTTDFVTYVQAGGDLTSPDMQVVELPSLSYDDIDDYFILGNKKDKVQLPAGANPKRLVKWLLLETLQIGREVAKIQFNF